MLLCMCIVYIAHITHVVSELSLHWLQHDIFTIVTIHIHPSFSCPTDAALRSTNHTDPRRTFKRNISPHIPGNGSSTFSGTALPAFFAMFLKMRFSSSSMALRSLVARRSVSNPDIFSSRASISSSWALCRESFPHVRLATLPDRSVLSPGTASF